MPSPSQYVPAYGYQPLTTEPEQIRLVNLLPGQQADDLRLQIVHRQFDSSKSPLKDERLGLQELQNTLPQDGKLWMRHNLEGRYVFVRFGRESVPNSYDHPDPNFDRSLYEQTDDEAPEVRYEALSYTWGTSDQSIRAYVVDDRGMPFAVLMLGENLAHVLKSLRRTEETRTLWVDALCIDQNNVAERNHEVKRMGNIYSSAAQVIVWLGEEGHDSSHAITTLQHFADQVEFFPPGSCGDAPGATEIKWWRPEYRLPYEDNGREWTAITNLFRREWFDRVWVLQECQLADRRALIQCGKDTITWSALRRAIMVLRHKYSAPPRLVTWLMAYSIGIQGRYRKSVSRLLAWAKTRDCKNPRDEVYGILNLAETQFMEQITPNYDLSMAEVYEDAFYAYLRVSQRLDLLCHCNLAHRIEGSPSYIPNWSVISNAITSVYSFGYRRRASGQSAASVRIHPKMIQALGVICTVVVTITRVVSDDVVDSPGAHLAEDPGLLLFKKFVADEFCYEAFKDFVLPIQSRAKHVPPLRDLPIWRCMLQSSSRTHSLKDDASNRKAVVIISCEDGRIGLAPPGVQPDDCIAVLLGCEVPMILRPHAEGQCLVVGPCFVPGYMEAESILGPLPPDWELNVTMLSPWDEVYYTNTVTQEKTAHDPRLEPLPDDWELFENSESGVFYRKKDGTTESRSDPRMTPESLQKLKVHLQWLSLI